MINRADIQMEDTLYNIYKTHNNHHYKQRFIKTRTEYVYISNDVQNEMKQTGNEFIQNEITTTSLYSVRSPGVSTSKQALYVSLIHVQRLQVLTVTEL